MIPFLRSLLDPFIGNRPILSPNSAASSSSSRPQLMSSTNPPSSTPAQPYKPDPLDVLRVKRLVTIASKSRLPIDLTDDILDFACYWPHVAACTTRALTARGASQIEDVFVLRSPPLCPEAAEWNIESGPPLGPLPQLHSEHPVREIVWTLRSHDQGWSGEDPATKGTYLPSYTWFDVSLERFHPGSVSSGGGEGGDGDDDNGNAQPSTSTPTNLDQSYSTQAMLAAWPGQTPPPCTLAHSTQPSTAHYAVPSPPAFPPPALASRSYILQRNVQAKSATTEHRIVWSWWDEVEGASGPAAEALTAAGRGADSADGTCVRSVRRGDCLVLWARARYPAWVNHVEGAEVEVYFAV